MQAASAVNQAVKATAPGLRGSNEVISSAWIGSVVGNPEDIRVIQWRFIENVGIPQSKAETMTVPKQSLSNGTADAAAGTGDQNVA